MQLKTIAPAKNSSQSAVADDLLIGCIELAEQAPTGGGLSNRRWMVFRDPKPSQNWRICAVLGDHRISYACPRISLGAEGFEIL